MGYTLLYNGTATNNIPVSVGATASAGAVVSIFITIPSVALDDDRALGRILLTRDPSALPGSQVVALRDQVVRWQASRFYLSDVGGIAVGDFISFLPFYSFPNVKIEEFF